MKSSKVLEMIRQNRIEDLKVEANHYPERFGYWGYSAYSLGW